MSNDRTFEDIDVPQGRFIGWGEIGQVIEIDVLSYGETDGSDFNGNECPLVSGFLTADATNFTDKGTKRETLKAGELVNVTCGQANLKKGVKIADPNRADVLRITYVDEYKTAKGTGKEFKVQIARGQGTGRSGEEGDSVSTEDL